MNDCGWKRARSDEQILQRITSIMNAAGTVFCRVPYEGVTMLMIAKEAGTTRSNIYRYFNTREEIFLAIYMNDIAEWAEEVIMSFTDRLTIEDFASKWTELLCRQKRMLQLTPLLSLSLEKNSSEELYLKTKVTLYELTEKFSSIMRRVLPELSEEHIYRFILLHQALSAGAWPMSQYTGYQTRILKENGLDFFKLEFSSFYLESITAYLKGIVSKGKFSAAGSAES